MNFTVLPIFNVKLQTEIYSNQNSCSFLIAISLWDTNICKSNSYSSRRGFMMVNKGCSLWVVSPIVSTSPSSPSPSRHSNSCTNLAIAMQEIVIACSAPAHTLFPPPNAIVLCNSVVASFPPTNLSGFHSSGLSHTFGSMLHPYMFIATCKEYVNLYMKPISSID